MKRRRIYRVTFLDHVQDGDEPIEFEVIGRVTRVCKKSVTLCCWGYKNSSDTDENTNTFTIVRSCITSCSELRAV